MINVVILAAGQGTRMHSSLPKVLQPLAGQPILKHILNAARTLSPERICVVYGYGGELVQSRIEDTDIVWVQQKQQLGTAHAVQQALPELPESGEVLVLLGDIPLIRGQTLQRLEEAAKEQSLTVLTAEVDEPAGYGRIMRDEQGCVMRIVEEKDATPTERNIREINTGVLVCSIEKLRQWLPRISNDNAKNEYYLTDIVAMAKAENLAVEAVQPAASWEILGVNDKMQLAALERIFQQNQARTLLAAGVTLADPARIDIRGDLSCGNDVYIDINCIFEGWVELENNVHIGPGCVLRNVRIDSGTQVAAYSYLEGCETGTNCIIGPYARIRGQTMLGCGVHIGNFVEIKNSELDDNAKTNHLSYIGDAVIGKRVNIGAGTITCNYDGVNKFQTVIEDDAFIGSDTQLVAPVRVGQGATLGAGTTLTHDAPAEQLTLSRAAQQTLPDWKRPGKKEISRGNK